MEMLRSISKILYGHKHKNSNNHSSSSSSVQKLVVVFLVLIINSKICLCTSLQPEEEEEEKAHLFLFGDSFFDAGNNNYINTSLLDRADFWPYGITFFNFSTGRFSDGRLISDFIAEYAQLPFIPPYLQPGRNNGFSFGVNFASAGAGALVDTFKGYVISLQEQLKNFKKVVEEERNYSNLGELVKTRRIMKRAVFLFSVGTNDYTSPLLTRNSSSNHLASSLSKSEYVNMVISNASLVIREIYRIGGRKFGFVNVPPTGCLPAIRILINLNEKIYDRRRRRQHYCHKEASSYAVLHNRALYRLLRELKSELRGFKFSLFDIHGALLRRINRPNRYGFKEGNTACCGAGEFRGTFSCGGRIPGIGFELCNNVKDYVFWDSFHLTEKAYEQLARQMWIKNTHNINITTTSPNFKYSFQYSVKDLFHLP